MTERAILARVVIIGDPCYWLSPNRTSGKHWAMVRQHKKVFGLAAYAGWVEAGCPVIDEKVHLAISIYRGRTMDPDNCLAALKWCVDGLKGNLFPDDSAKWVEYGPIRFVTGRKFAGPNARVEIEVYPAGETVDGG